VIIPGTKSKIRRRKSQQFESYDQALKEFARYRKENLERFVRGPIPTFRQFVEMYFDVITKGQKPSGVDADRYRLNAIIVPAIGNLPLDRVSSSVIDDFVRDQRVAGKAARTINGYVKVIGRLLREAVRREEISSFPVRQKLPHLKEPKLRLEMSPEEQGKFLAAFDDEDAFRSYVTKERSKGTVVTSPHFGGVPRSFGGGRTPDSAAVGYHYDRFRASKPFFVVGIETGLRRGDLLGLKWEAIDLEKDLITLTTSKCEVPVEIPVSVACRAALEECLARPVVGQNVFLTDEGQPYNARGISRYHKIAKGIAGITRRLRIHDLRHTFGSNLSSQGVPVQMVAKMMGHSSTRMTEQYARPDVEVTRSVVAQALEAVRERREKSGAQREVAVNRARELPRELTTPKKERPRRNGATNPFGCLMLNGGADGARTRDLRRDRPAF